MQRICEDEHVRNLANFDVLIAKIIGFGAHYKPAKVNIQLEALTIVSQNAKMSIANAVGLMNEHMHLIAVREEAFEALKLLNERLFKELNAITTISETEAYMLVGTRKDLSNPFTSPERYDYLLENFCSIIKLIKTIAFYSPIQEDLQVSKLAEFYAVLYLKNNEVKRAAALLSNARSIRDEVMYREGNGLVELAATIKMYIKYHYGWESKQYKQVSGLVLKKPRLN